VNVALKPTAPGFKYATDRGLIAPEAPVSFYFLRANARRLANPGRRMSWAASED